MTDPREIWILRDPDDYAELAELADEPIEGAKGEFAHFVRADLAEGLEKALQECADDLETEIKARTPDRETMATDRRIYKRDIAPVRAARAALAAYRGETRGVDRDPLKGVRNEQ